MPPSSFDLDQQTPSTLKGIAGSPGVAVGPALVLGDLRASFVRRHIHTAQIQPELERVQQARRGREEHAAARSSARMPTAMREASAILEAYQMMLVGPDAARSHRARRSAGEKKCAEWAVSEASEEIVAMFGPRDAGDRDAYISERRHDVEFVCDRLLRALVGEESHHAVAPRASR